mgnify:FL=1
MEEKKEEKWLMPEDIKVIETNKPEEMLHKYLAEYAVKTWTENFVDEDTGETVPVERNEVIFDCGTYIDESLLPKIMFSIQSEELKTVKVCDKKPMAKRNNMQVRRYIVKLSNGLHKSNIYTTRAKTPEDAAQMVCDYYSIYGIPTLSGNFSVIDSAATGLRLLYKEEFGEKYWDNMYMMTHVRLEGKVNNTDKVLPPPFSQNRFFKVNVCRWYEGEGKYEKDTYNYIIPALTLEDAQSLMIDYFIAMDGRRGSERINDITSISKANIDFAIPQSYAKAWFMKKYGDTNDY